MSEPKQKVKKLLDDLAIKYRWVDHAPVYTVAEALEHVEDKEPVKNLLLKDKSGQFFLVVMPGANSLDLKSLATKLGSKRLSFANVDHMQRLLHVTPGAVSLFGLVNDVDHQVAFVIAKSLLEVDEVGFHPNENNSTVFISTSDIEKIVLKTGHRMKAIEF